MCVRACVRAFACVRACVLVHEKWGHIYIYIYIYIYTCVYIYICICMYVRVRVISLPCMSVCECTSFYLVSLFHCHHAILLCNHTSSTATTHFFHVHLFHLTSLHQKRFFSRNLTTFVSLAHCISLNNVSLTQVNFHACHSLQAPRAVVPSFRCC